MHPKAKQQNNNIMKILAIVIVMVSLGVASAQAQTKVKARLTTQRARIAEGVNSGDLNRRETAKIVGQQQRVRKAERVAKRDGVVTGQEKLQLNRMQSRASKNIAFRKNN
jgi:hypothetical protein